MTPPPSACDPAITKFEPDLSRNPNSKHSATNSLSHYSNQGHQSRISISSTQSQNHKEYLDSLHCPTAEMVEHISAVQEQKEKEVIQRRLSQHVAESGQGRSVSDTERESAAGLIQRNYRGHRERRMLNGLSLDPSTRWVEAIKEAKYRALTEPHARDSQEVNGGASIGLDGEIERPMSSHARQNWKKIGLIARRAGGDEDSDTDIVSDGEEGLNEEERAKRRKMKEDAKQERQKTAKMMDLQYFLEMVDLKHRYGSNLRTYHEEWKKSDTKENFFYWLDYGEGRSVDTVACPRERLDRERVRYLSKEERLDYLVKIDHDGRLCWAKNGARIDTTVQYKDSIHGIVPDTDDTPAYRAAEGEAATGLEAHSESSSDSDNDMDDTDARADKYATPDFDKSKGVKKVKHVSAATIFNKLLRGSVKKNTWIFVADTSFRLYVGIKQSGAFQHSSFLHGSRISAAGLIKIKDGRLDRLSPLSGHYRPPVANFRAFIHALKDAGVDMSHVSISRSYAILVGLEAYVKTRRRGKKFVKKLIHHRDKILDPEEAAKREELERDKSESAAKERLFLEKKDREREEERRNSLIARFDIRSKASSVKEYGDTKEGGSDPDVQHAGKGPENAIAPEGTRHD